jgi:hypothetical protein
MLARLLVLDLPQLVVRRVQRVVPLQCVRVARLLRYDGYD